MYEDIFTSHGHMSEKQIGLAILAEVRMARAEQASQFHFLNSKINNLMDKATFLAAFADLKAEVVTVGTKVDALEQKINNSPTDVDPDIVAAFQDLKGSVDALSTKADNTPVTAPAEGTGDGTTAG